MDRSAFSNRFIIALLLSSVAALAGCSGSSSGSAQDDGNQQPPAEQPPAEDPPGEDPPDEGGPEPDVDLSAAESVVASGESVVLTWTSENASSCNASGGWSGSKGTEGSATVGPLTQSTTFSLTCTGDGGNAVTMLSVGVLGVVNLEWEAPTENVDGSPLEDLDGYRIYYGELSGSYTDNEAIADPNRTDYNLTLPSGSYYFAMTALDAQGNESAYSNEVVKVVN